MNTFIYTVKYSSEQRGYDQTVKVWRLKHNTPIYVGHNDKISGQSTVGCKGEACKIIAQETSFKTNNYEILNKGVRVLSV